MYCIPSNRNYYLELQKNAYVSYKYFLLFALYKSYRNDTSLDALGLKIKLC